MPSTSITIKPNNHRAYTCPNNKKIQLMNNLVSQNPDTDIIVVSSDNIDYIKNNLDNKNIKVMDDKSFIGNKELKCEMLISYNVPDKAIIYMARVAKATIKAIILVDENEQKKLYPIETMLSRAIKQEVLDGFEYEIKKVQKIDNKYNKNITKEQIKEIAKKRYEEKTHEPKEKSFDKPKREYKLEDKKNTSSDKWDKKNKAKNKFLGKDKNGKAMFSGKSGDRNHHYDGTPKKAGRKINITSLKKSDNTK